MDWPRQGQQPERPGGRGCRAVGRARAPVPRSPAGSSQFCSGPERASVPSDLGPGPCSLERPSGQRWQLAAPWVHALSRGWGGTSPRRLLRPRGPRAHTEQGRAYGVTRRPALSPVRQGPEAPSRARGVCARPRDVPAVSGRWRKPRGGARRARAGMARPCTGGGGSGEDGRGRRSVPTRPEGACVASCAQTREGTLPRGVRPGCAGPQVGAAAGREAGPGQCCRRGPRCVPVSPAAVALGWPPARSAPAQGWATLPHAQG